MRAATIPQTGTPVHRSADLESLFRDTFFHRFRTILVGGASEPLYQPGEPHRIVYTRDYFRSALHEVAHWCVAGPQRRQREDYGYWYAPDGRNAEQQALFTRVEVYPQALELLFCAAARHDFRVSLDNLDGEPGDEQAFAEAVHVKAQALVASGPNARARTWLDALAGHYGGNWHRPGSVMRA